jgi:tetratricopeptide (TPR) repeat protein
MTVRLVCALLLLAAVSCASKRLSDWQEGLQHLRTENYRAAITALERELLRHPERFEAQCLIGYAYEKLGEPEAALAAYAKTLTLNPVNACAFTGSGRIYAAQKRWREAWDAFLQARGSEANDALLALYPAFRAAVDTGEFAMEAPAAPVAAPTAPQTVIVSVSVIPATVKVRPVIALTAAAYGPQNSLEQTFITALAATAGDRIARCHDRFYAAGRTAALDERFTLALRPDGTVDAPAEDPEKVPVDMKECVAAALATVRFPALPGTN